MNPRFQAVAVATERKTVSSDKYNGHTSKEEELFGSHVFNRHVMHKMLPRPVYENLIDAMEGKERIFPEYADIIASAMKDWAISLGATHYTHWFQPLTGSSAEKHDSFIDWQSPDRLIVKLRGKELIQGEPDASSFPSGGLRSTYEARGYTGWDPTSPVFIWKGGDGVTLCIPSIFFSWTGDVLDYKIPLLRSDKKLSDAVLRLLRLTGIKASHVFSTLGLEQEYFVVDRALRNLRPDLVLSGKTVYGAAPSKGQELQDHYFGSVKDRILSFMHDFEISALRLGIPVKTRHNEVAPSQHEVAPIFEKSSTAIDHNILLMELMRHRAQDHNLSCLLHEKPFHGLNGSGKHSNWSLLTDTGINLLDPSDTPENSVHFLILVTAILNGIHQHADLLRAAIGSASNDYRLGGHEAPPAILSVYLGNELEHVLESISEKGAHDRKKISTKYNMGIPVIPDLSKDNTDRNRTSPFAFTGNKFEFRAVGSSSNPSFAITVLNVAVAESLNQILDEIEDHLNSKEIKDESIVVKSVLPTLKKYLVKSKAIRFSGDNYSKDWLKEAEKRGLQNITQSIFAFDSLTQDSTAAIFEGVLTPAELASRREIMAEHYVLALQIEVNLMLELFQTQVYPAAIKHQILLAEALQRIQLAVPNANVDRQQEELKRFSEIVEKAIDAADKLREIKSKIDKQQDVFKKGRMIAEMVITAAENLREHVDQLETLVDDSIWPLPKYRELLFIV